MHNFADQCLDMARVILSHNIGAINADGSIEPTPGELGRSDESGHAALALGEFYRATQETRIGKTDVVELVARCVSSQLRQETESENGLAYAALGLLSFGPSNLRVICWTSVSSFARTTMITAKPLISGKPLRVILSDFPKKTKRDASLSASLIGLRATARADSATICRARRKIWTFSAVATTCTA